MGKATGIVVNNRVRGAVQVLAWLPWQVTIETRDITVAIAPAKIIGSCGDTTNIHILYLLYIYIDIFNVNDVMQYLVYLTCYRNSGN